MLKSKKLKFVFVFVLLTIFFQTLLHAIERRREQFVTDFGYVAIPIPFSVPGVGTGLGVAGNINNIPMFGEETTTDVYALTIPFGDVKGSIVGVTDIPLWPKTLIFDILYGEFNKYNQRSYLDRTMNSKKDDFLNLELDQTQFSGGRMILSLFDRMFELYRFQYNIKSNISAIRDNEGNLIYEVNQGFDVQAITMGSLFDYTDDRTDPLKGVRFNYNYADSPRRDSDSADFYVQEFNLSGYIPIEKSTIALNWYRAGATVREEGNTDLEALKTKELKECVANCDAATIQSRAENQQALNRYGSAGSLGGPTRLRSFAQGRYSGPQVAFRGVEFRWNFSDKETPIEYYIISDTAINFQLAFFYEEGSIADQASDLWKIKKSSTGLGFRLVTSSQFVYRIDLASGQEGNEFIFWFDYPWGAVQ